MKRQRRLELAVVASAAVFILALVVSFRPGRRPASAARSAVPDAPDASGEATTLLEGFDFTESVGGKALMRIKADRTVGYGPAAGLAPNLYAGEKVELTVFPDDGPPVTVHSDRADYDERTRESRLSGHVRWNDPDGSLATTELVVFHPKTRRLEAPGRVEFTRGQTRMNAPSARYDLAERVVRFAGPVEASTVNAGSGALSRMTARDGLYRRDTGQIELTAVTAGSANGDRLAADRLDLQMAPTGGKPSSARATGNVRGEIAAAAAPGDAPKAPRPYSGDVATLEFDAEGAMRAVALDGAPALFSDAGRRLAARRIEVGLTDGKASTASAAGDVRIDFTDGHAVAREGRLGFGPDGEAQNVTLQGDVRMEADGKGGQADKAVEVSSQGVWILTGNSRESAHVDSAGSRLSADRIELDRAHKTATGEGHARAVFAPDAQKKVTRNGFVGDPKKPTYAKADRIVLEDATKLATLTARASLWQEDSSLFADDITMSDADRTVRATGQVRAVMAPAPPKGAEAARPASVITAKSLLYRDEDRSARFEGGVGVTRGGWQSSGGQATAWLDKDGGVESVEISGDVKMTDRSVGRSAKAEKALDSPKLGKTTLWGNPARVIDAGGNQVAGAVLTIADRGRSVEITAPEGGKTETIHRTEKD